MVSFHNPAVPAQLPTRADRTPTAVTFLLAASHYTQRLSETLSVRAPIYMHVGHALPPPPVLQLRVAGSLP